MNNSKIVIALYDSGIGGLSLLYELVKNVKGVDVIYFGDNKNTPYGNKNYSTLYSLCKTNVKNLFSLGADVVTLACNTLSTTVLNRVSQDEEIKSLGIITGVYPPPPKQNIKSALLCTIETAKSNYVKSNFKSSVVIPLPFLAGEIERYIFTPEKINYAIDLNNVPSGVEKVILGCTHYSLIKNLIIKKLNEKNTKTDSVKVEVSDGIILAVSQIKNAIKTVIDSHEKQKTIKNNDFKVTCDHHLLKGAKTLTTCGNRVFFIGESADYNKKVFKHIYKRPQK